jgi:16S rRNA G966 N2-methylase RsmD
VDKNLLFYGDNLQVLREHHRDIPSESVDLVYLDPPFNSKVTYNVTRTCPLSAVHSSLLRPCAVEFEAEQRSALAGCERCTSRTSPRRRTASL